MDLFITLPLWKKKKDQQLLQELFHTEKKTNKTVPTKNNDLLKR